MCTHCESSLGEVGFLIRVVEGLVVPFHNGARKQLHKDDPCLGLFLLHGPDMVDGLVEDGDLFIHEDRGH